MVETLEQRIHLVEELYSLVHLIAPEQKDNVTEEEQKEEQKSRFLSYVDLMPENIANAVVATIKMNINRKAEL